jgi:hypothetical protein
MKSCWLIVLPFLNRSAIVAVTMIAGLHSCHHHCNLPAIGELTREEWKKAEVVQHRQTLFSLPWSRRHTISQKFQKFFQKSVVRSLFIGPTEQIVSTLLDGRTQDSPPISSKLALEPRKKSLEPVEMPSPFQLII